MNELIRNRLQRQRQLERESYNKSIEYTRPKPTNTPTYTSPSSTIARKDLTQNTKVNTVITRSRPTFTKK